MVNSTRPSSNMLSPTPALAPPLPPPSLPDVATPVLRRATRLGRQDHEPGPRGHRQTTSEGASWFPRNLPLRQGPGRAKAATAAVATARKRKHPPRHVGCSSVWPFDPQLPLLAFFFVSRWRYGGRLWSSLPGGRVRLFAGGLLCHNFQQCEWCSLIGVMEGTSLLGVPVLY